MAVAAATGMMRGFAVVGPGMLAAPFFVRMFGPMQTVEITIMIEMVVTGFLLPSV